MIVGHWYNIIPLQCELFRILTTHINYPLQLHLQKHDNFNCNLKRPWKGDIHESFDDCQLCFIFDQFPEYIFNSVSFTKKRCNGLSGRRSYFTQMCLKGDFSMYESAIQEGEFQFFRYQRQSKRYKYPGNDPTYGLMILICIFMRYDLMISFYTCSLDVYCPYEILWVLINPDTLLEYKNVLKNKCMIMITEKEEVNFDIYNNSRYHPRWRLKMLYNLVFSTKMAASLQDETIGCFVNTKMAKCVQNRVMKLFRDFEYFCQNWKLDYYSELKNNKQLQQNYHKKFQMIVQGIFCMSNLYLNKEPPEDAIVFSSTKWNVHRLSFCKHHNYIDVYPHDQDQLAELYQLMTGEYDESSQESQQMLAKDMSKPRNKCKCNQQHCWHKDLKFPQPKNPKQAFLDLWKVFEQE